MLPLCTGAILLRRSLLRPWKLDVFQEVQQMSNRAYSLPGPVSHSFANTELAENKTVEKILLIHESQIEWLVFGIDINWNVVLLRDGSQRVVRKHLEELTSGRE